MDPGADSVLNLARAVHLVGGAGLAAGRRVFTAADPSGLVARLRDIFHQAPEAPVAPTPVASLRHGEM